jgi:hypothetical protein
MFEVFDTEENRILPPATVAVTGSGRLLIYKEDRWHVIHSNRYRICWRA